MENKAGMPRRNNLFHYIVEIFLNIDQHLDGHFFSSEIPRCAVEKKKKTAQEIK
jgi:hypothetical protein